MEGFAKGMATTSGWTLVRCDCRNRIHQGRTLKDLARPMMMAAVAGYGDDVHVSTVTTESIVQDFDDGNESSNYFCESLIYPVFCGCRSAAVYRTSKLRRGDYGRCPRLSSCIITTGHYART